jgi:hypothetical protein
MYRALDVLRTYYIRIYRFTNMTDRWTAGKIKDNLRRGVLLLVKVNVGAVSTYGHRSSPGNCPGLL